ncbi:MAG TPA: alanine/glycine:cation symporter family protein, partial [Longimicrobium sp.]|nr:alanine/glycine:cation symporter family protein [Longimicrobium sp.]
EAPAAGFMGTLDRAMGHLNTWIGAFFFFDILFWDDEHVLPFIVLWLVAGAVFFTLRMRFVNFWAFGHAVQVVRGKYSDPNDAGEVSHFQALSTALSATVGLGNIAGVAIAVSTGGPGATFWMIVAGLLGMTAKFTECTLGQQYREVRPDGRIMGGAMEYLSKGLAEKGWPRLGMVLAVLFSVLCVGGSFGGGNSFQVNQSLNAMQETFPVLGAYPWAYGLVMVFLVGLVIIGGIRRIASVADKIVPLMCGVYVLAALVILFDNAAQIPAAFGIIFREAFTPSAAYGGFIGTLVIGFQRAAFSNEAGAGSAAIAHSAAKTPYPVREGIVALLEPFIDTVVICTMTALVIVITGAYNNPAYADLIEQSKGAALTSRAMGEHLTWFPLILSFAVFLFAYSTMISWSYYGERCWAWLFGDRTSGIYRGLFLLFVFLGSVITSANVLNFGDLMILGMAFPNILGVVILSGKVKRELEDYWAKKKSGEIRMYDKAAAGVRPG